MTVGAGKEYWLSAAMTAGVRERESGLYFQETGNEKEEESGEPTEEQEKKNETVPKEAAIPSPRGSDE